MSDVFLSYAKEDKRRAKALAEALQSYGWSVWWDAEIPPGQTWDEMIEEEVTTAKCVVVMWSQRSIGKHWVRTEATLALERGVLVPVLIENVMPPLAFRRIQAAPVFDWNGQGEHDGFDHLLRAVERLAGAPQLAQSRCQQEAREPERDEHAVPPAALALEAPVLAPVVAPMIEKRAAPAPSKKRRAIVAGFATFICVTVLGYIFREAIIPAFHSLEPAGFTLATPPVSITLKPAPRQATNPQLGDLGQTSSDAPERKEGTAASPNFAADTSRSGTSAPTSTTGAAVQTPVPPPAAAAFPAEAPAFPAEAAQITRLPNFEDPAKAQKIRKMQQQRTTSTAARTTTGHERRATEKRVEEPTNKPSITQKQLETKPSGSGWKIIRD